MSRIPPHKPAAQRQPRMQDRKYLDTFREAPVCEACGKPNDGTIVPAHFGIGNYARGMKADDALVAGLCFDCHMIADVAEDPNGRAWVWFNVLRKLMRDRHGEWQARK